MEASTSATAPRSSDGCFPPSKINKLVCLPVCQEEIIYLATPSNLPGAGYAWSSAERVSGKILNPMLPCADEG